MNGDVTMIEQLGYVKETISLRENDIKCNEFETNNLLMDDILLALGYNKRRDRGVRAVYTPGADWEVVINGTPRFLITVYGYQSEEPSLEALTNTFELADTQLYMFAVATDGEKLHIYKNGAKLLSVENIFDDSADEILTALSKDGWDPKFISKYKINSLITDEVIMKALANDTEELIEIIENSENIITIDIIFERVAEYIKEHTAHGEEVNNEESEEKHDNEAETVAAEIVEQLKSEIETLKSENNTLMEDKAKLEEEINKLSSAEPVHDYSNEYNQAMETIKGLNEKVASRESEVEALNSEISLLKEEAAQLKLASEDNSEIVGLTESNNKLRNEIKELSEKEMRLKEELESAQNTTKNLSDELAETTAKLIEADGERTTLRGELEIKNKNIEELAAKLEEASHINITPAFNGENEYRAKIEELTTENQLLKVELNKYKSELTDIKKKQDEAEDERVVLARQLLDAIEDNPEMERTYVGVVNSKLFQINEISKFVGSCLQELYSAVSFELMQLLFDGDIFVLKQTTEAGDLMLNARNYAIDFGDLSEEEILSRLATLFGKFDQVVFNYKVIGNKAIKKSRINLVKDNETAFAEAFGQTVTDTFEEEPEVIMEPKEDRKLLGLALIDVSGILWSESNPIKALAAIGDNNRLFKVDSYDFESTIKNGVDALINISSSVQTSIHTIRETDLSTLSSVIHEGKQSDTDVRILDTKYYIEETSQQKVISAILAIAELLQLDSQSVYMYFEADYIEDWNDFYAIESSLNLESKFNLEDTEETGEVLHCILSGTVVDFIQTLDGMLEAEKSFIDGTLAVRTRYLQKSLRTTQDVGIILSEILAKTENPEDVIEVINKSNIYNKKLILSEEDLAGVDENTLGVISTGAAQYYVTDLPAYAVTLMVMMAHREVNGDSIIDIRIALNSRVYTAYSSGIATADSREYLLSRLLVEVTNGKVRSINK